MYSRTRIEGVNGRVLGRGFTLLEMMLVVVIMGLLIGVAAVSLGGRGLAAKIGITKSTMNTAASMVKNYQLEQGVYPATLQDLVPKYLEKLPLDAWKRPLVYIPGQGGTLTTGQHPFSLYSLGPSGNQGDPDNIDYWEEDAPNTGH